MNYSLHTLNDVPISFSVIAQKSAFCYMEVNLVFTLINKKYIQVDAVVCFIHDCVVIDSCAPYGLHTEVFLWLKSCALVLMVGGGQSKRGRTTSFNPLKYTKKVVYSSPSRDNYLCRHV